MQSPGGGYEDDFDDFEESPKAKGAQRKATSGDDESKSRPLEDSYEDDFDDEAGGNDGRAEGKDEEVAERVSEKSLSSSLSSSAPLASSSSTSQTSDRVGAKAAATSSDSHKEVTRSAQTRAKPTWNEINFDRDVELGDRIGGGGFALVYKGWLRGRNVALKTLFDPRGAADKEVMEEYNGELYTLARLGGFTFGVALSPKSIAVC